MFAGEDPSAASGVWHKRPRSRPHLRRPPQLGSDSLGSADASAVSCQSACQTSGSGGVRTTGAPLGQPRARDRGAWEQL